MGVCASGPDHQVERMEQGGVYKGTSQFPNSYRLTPAPRRSGVPSTLADQPVLCRPECGLGCPRGATKDPGSAVTAVPCQVKMVAGEAKSKGVQEKDCVQAVNGSSVLGMSSQVLKQAS